MATDWKDALAALRGEVPQAPQQEETPEDNGGDKATKVQREPLHMSMERKGRAGKTATIVYGFTCGDAEVAEVARALRRGTGTGGSSRGGEILLQGDCRQRAAELLRDMGYRVK